MKKLFILCFLLSVLLTYGQQPTVAQCKSAAEKAYAVFNSYKNLINLKTIAGGANDAKVKEYKSLFAKDAVVEDDINPADTIYWNLGLRNIKTVDEYLAATGYNFRPGLNGSITRSNISFDSISYKIVKIIYERNVNATDKRGYKYSNQDTMIMTIKLSNDYSSATIASLYQVNGKLKCIGCPTVALADLPSASNTAKPKKDNNLTPQVDNTTANPKKEDKPIASKPEKKSDAKKDQTKDEIVKEKPKKKEDKPVSEKPQTKPKNDKAKEEKVRCPNDDDCDGVPNFSDKCPTVYGPASNGGCPVKKDVVAVGISINVGGGLGIASVGSDPAAFSNFYSNQTDVKKASFNTSAGGGFNAGLDIDLLFGKQKNMGISVGILFMQNIVNADVTNFGLSYKEGLDGNNENFRRILSADSYSEKLTFTNLSIPILFKYQTSMNKKIGLNLEVGPVLSVSASAASTVSSSLNFEARYSTNPNSATPLDYSASNANSDLILTNSFVQGHYEGNPSSQNLSNYFERLYNKGYYVGLGRSYSGSGGTVSYSFGYGGLLRLGGVYRFNPMLSLLFGISASIIYNDHTSSSFAPVQTGSDFKSGVTFQSFLNGIGGGLSTQVGANIGLQIRFGRKK